MNIPYNWSLSSDQHTIAGHPEFGLHLPAASWLREFPGRCRWWSWEYDNQSRYMFKLCIRIRLILMYIWLLYRCIQYIWYIYIYYFIQYICIYLYIYMHDYIYIQYYNSHCLVLLKQITPMMMPARVVTFAGLALKSALHIGSRW